MKNTILVVDDEPNYRLILSEIMLEEGFEVFIADSGENALKIVTEGEPLDLIITDMRMDGMDGMELLKTVKEINPDLPIIMITAFGEVEMAVAAMQAGAYNYLTKPFNNEELLITIRNAVEHYSLHKENLRLRDTVQTRYRFANMIGKNKKMQQLYSLITKIAPTPSSVMITGESGTGKELVARAIHFNSPRKDKALISLNCAGLPEQLLESELFGHEKGSFTGATSQRKGRFEIADQGTFFLDEVGEMPLALQAKLLRVIQERTFERVGGNETLKVDVRIVAATNRDLKEEVGKGNFREDLYYRLNVLHLHLPPLRERKDDIPMLVDHFLAKFAKQLDDQCLQITAKALRYLTRQTWEGNIRELENTIERAAILCSESCIDLDDVLQDVDVEPHFELKDAISLDALKVKNGRLPDILDAIEKNMIEDALIEAEQVQAHAAERLGITKSLLQYKMKKYAIQKK